MALTPPLGAGDSARPVVLILNPAEYSALLGSLLYEAAGEGEALEWPAMLESLGARELEFYVDGCDAVLRVKGGAEIGRVPIDACAPPPPIPYDIPRRRIAPDPLPPDQQNDAEYASISNTYVTNIIENNNNILNFVTPTAPGTNPRCAVAYHLTERLEAALEDAMQVVDFYTELDDSVRELARLVLGAAGVAVPQFGAILLITELVSEALQLGTAQVRAAIDDAWRDRLRCAVFDSTNTDGSYRRGQLNFDVNMSLNVATQAMRVLEASLSDAWLAAQVRRAPAPPDAACDDLEMCGPIRGWAVITPLNSFIWESYQTNDGRAVALPMGYSAPAGTFGQRYIALRSTALATSRPYELLGFAVRLGGASSTPVSGSLTFLQGQTLVGTLPQNMQGLNKWRSSSGLLAKFSAAAHRVAPGLWNGMFTEPVNRQGLDVLPHTEVRMTYGAGNQASNNLTSTVITHLMLIGEGDVPPILQPYRVV